MQQSDIKIFFLAFVSRYSVPSLLVICYLFFIYDAINGLGQPADSPSSLTLADHLFPIFYIDAINWLEQPANLLSSLTLADFFKNKGEAAGSTQGSSSH